MGYSQEQCVHFKFTKEKLEISSQIQTLMIDGTNWKLTKNPKIQSKSDAFKVIFEGCTWPENLPNWIELIWKRWAEGISSEADTRARLSDIETVLTKVSEPTRSWG